MNRGFLRLLELRSVCFSELTSFKDSKYYANHHMCRCVHMIVEVDKTLMKI